MSKNTVKLYVGQYLALRRPCEELIKLTDYELNKLFHPPQQLIQSNERLKQLHDFFPEMEKQMRRRGMTILKQIEVYNTLHPQGYKATSFYIYYNQWSKKVNPTMHMEHKVGDKMYVDYTGATLPFVDTETGEIKKAQVFVAILVWSQYAYVEAMQSQNAEDFISACENAFHYFKGVPLAIVPDNLKSAVIKASRYVGNSLHNLEITIFVQVNNFMIDPKKENEVPNQEEVEYYLKKYNIGGIKDWEPEILQRIVEHFKYGETVIEPLKKNLNERHFPKTNYSG